MSDDKLFYICGTIVAVIIFGGLVLGGYHNHQRQMKCMELHGKWDGSCQFPKEQK